MTDYGKHPDLNGPRRPTDPTALYIAVYLVCMFGSFVLMRAAESGATP